MNTHILAAAMAAILASGCATKDYVHENVQAQTGPVRDSVRNLDQRVDRLAEALANLTNSQTASNARAQSILDGHAGRIARSEADIAEVTKTAREALERAIAAGKLAEGKLLYEIALKDDTLKFKPDSVALSKEAMAVLDTFAAKLKNDNKNVFIEIQGHTDSRGKAAANLRIGEARAEAVRRYLNMKGGIPLHRMAAISYGATEPVASNVNRDGRSQNRRVALVVLN